MSTSTYMDVANEILKETNEVVLTSSTFTNAVGFQSFVLGRVKQAMYDMNTKNYKWPFLAADTSTEPHLGNTYVDCTAGTRWYLLNTGSTGVDTDYDFVDWENFTLTTLGVAGETTPYTVEKLAPINLQDWSKFYSQSEAQAEANNNDNLQPIRVIRHPDGRRFGLSPIPDKDYKIYFYAWKQFDPISVYNDTFEFPEKWVWSVLIPRIRYYVWMFKENPQQAQMAEKEYKEGMRRMREQLLEDGAKKYLRDDRKRFV